MRLAGLELCHTYSMSVRGEKGSQAGALQEGDSRKRGFQSWIEMAAHSSISASPKCFLLFELK